MGSTSHEIACNQFLRCASRQRCPVVEHSSMWTLLRSVNDKDENKRPVFTDSAHVSSKQVWTFVSATLYAGWSSSFTSYSYCDAMLRMYYTTCSDVYILRDVTVKLVTPCTTVLFRTTFQIAVSRPEDTMRSSGQFQSNDNGIRTRRILRHARNRCVQQCSWCSCRAVRAASFRRQCV